MISKKELQELDERDLQALIINHLGIINDTLKRIDTRLGYIGKELHRHLLLIEAEEETDETEEPDTPDPDPVPSP